MTTRDSVTTDFPPRTRLPWLRRALTVAIVAALACVGWALMRPSETIVPLPQTWRTRGMAWTPKWNTYNLNQPVSVWDINRRSNSEWAMRDADLYVVERDYATLTTQAGISSWPFRVTLLAADGTVTSSPAMPPAGYPLLASGQGQLWTFSQSTPDTIRADRFDLKSLQPLASVPLDLRGAPCGLPAGSVAHLVNVTVSNGHCYLSGSRVALQNMDYQGPFQLDFDLGAQRWNPLQTGLPTLAVSPSLLGVAPRHTPGVSRQTPLRQDARAHDQSYWFDATYPELLLEQQLLDGEGLVIPGGNGAAADFVAGALNHSLGMSSAEYYANDFRRDDLIDQVLVRDPGETVARPLTDDTAQALRATSLVADQALHVFALDGGTLLFAQIVDPTPAAVNQGHGLLRLGRRAPGESTIDWYGWMPLPPFSQVRNMVSTLEIYAGDTDWRLYLIGNGWDSTSNAWMTQCQWTSIAIPYEAPSPHGRFLVNLNPPS
ncbi:MAG: hypothetical protein ABI743_03340 [bacterium]